MTKTTQLSEEALQARREYIRTWRKKNPDKVAQYRKNYWERKAKQTEGIE